MSVDPIGTGLVVAAMAVESCAQLCLKVGAGGGAGQFRPGLRSLATRLVPAGAAKPWIVLGVLAYGIEILLYTLALRSLDISVAFPLGSLCFVGVAVLSRLALGEAVGRVRWLGIGTILAGIWLMLL